MPVPTAGAKSEESASAPIIIFAIRLFFLRGQSGTQAHRTGGRDQRKELLARNTPHLNDVAALRPIDHDVFPGRAAASGTSPRPIALPPLPLARPRSSLLPSNAPCCVVCNQVEYAIEAINNAGTCVGLKSTDGVVLAAERRVVSKLLAPSKTSEKTYTIDDHATCLVAGLTADANILIQEARVGSQRYLYQYHEPIPVENMVKVRLATVHPPSPPRWTRPLTWPYPHLPAGHVCRAVCVQLQAIVHPVRWLAAVRCGVLVRGVGPSLRFPAVPKRPVRQLQRVESDGHRAEQPVRKEHFKNRLQGSVLRALEPLRRRRRCRHVHDAPCPARRKTTRSRI